jgi:hypothetical protein
VITLRRGGGAGALTGFLVCVFVLLTASSASARGDWYSNQWRSPTRNIACRYFPSFAAVKCETENDAFALALERGGGRAFRTRYVAIPYRVPVLPYGTHWLAPSGGIRCSSSFNGMTCRSGGHGFFINRTSYRLW